MHRRWWWVIGSGCGLLVVLGLTLGSREAESQEPARVAADPAASAPVVTDQGTEAPSPASEGTTSSAALERAHAANRQLQGRVAELETALAKATDAGTTVVVRPGDVRDVPADEVGPLPFGSELSHAYTPEGFEAVTLQMERECGLGLEVVAIDCTEYPCMAWTRLENPAGRQMSMDACGPWTEAFPNGTTVIGSATRMAPNGNKEVYIAWMAVPEDNAQLKHAWRRARLRASEMHAALGFE